MQKKRAKVMRNLLKGPRNFWQLAVSYEDHLIMFASEIKKLADEVLVSIHNGEVSLTPLGKQACLDAKLIPFTEVACPCCSGRGLVVEGLFGDLFAEFQRIASQRPQPVPEFDQGYVDASVTFARVLLMYSRGDLEGRNILILGDDDLTGIAAALTGLPRSITVLDIDNRLVEFIDKTARKYGWGNLSVSVYDVRNPLPRALAGQYDTFLTDPLETRLGLTLFLSRGAEALKGSTCSGYFGLTSLEASSRKWHYIQRLLLDMNFIIREVLTDFHSYVWNRSDPVETAFPYLKKLGLSIPPPPLKWYKSSIFRIETVDTPKPALTGALTEGAEIYADDEATSLEFGGR